MLVKPRIWLRIWINRIMSKFITGNEDEASTMGALENKSDDTYIGIEVIDSSAALKFYSYSTVGAFVRNINIKLLKEFRESS